MKINNNNEVVMTKYIKNGKEVVVYNTKTGECRVLEMKNNSDEVTVKKIYNIVKMV